MLRIRRSWLLVPVLLCLAWQAAVAYTPDPNAPRDQVPAAYQWHVQDLYPSLEAWQADLARVEEDIPRVAAYKGHLGASADTLYAAIQLMEDTLQRLYKLHTYASCRADVDLSNSQNMELEGRVGFLFQKFGSATAYVDPELLSLPEGLLDRFMAEKPELETYRYYFQNLLRMKPHTLSEPEERILALTGQLRQVPGTAAQKLRDVEMEFPEIVDEQGEHVRLTLSGFTGYRASPVYNVRKQAADAFFTTFRKYENTLAATLDGAVKSHILTKDARHYDSCLEAALTPDDISPSVYRMLIDTINANLDRTLHRYVALRRKVLGLDGPLTFANLYNPMIQGDEGTYPYEEGRKLVLTGLQPLGKDYLRVLTEGTDPANGWIDVYPNKNKRSGAYSTGMAAKGAHPFVLHNYDNTLDAVFTLAHEFGHAMHSYYSSHNQPFVYADYTTFLAEIASTCNEQLLLNYLLKHEKDPEKKLLLLNKELENIRLTIFRQTLFAEFELRFHEYAEQGHTLTADYLDSLYADLITRYYGPEFQMGPDDATEWAYIPHFYYNFYVFTYATGLTSGISLAEQIMDQGRKAADRYIDNMLKAGSSRPPLEILKSAGVDLETPQPILTMLDLFERTIDQFDKLWTKTYGKKK